MSDDIGRDAVRGVAWLGGGQLVRQVVGLATTATLARLLTPDDFGLFGMTYIAMEAAQLLTAFGFGAAIVQRQETSQRVLTAALWSNVLLGLVIGLLLVGAGPLLAWYFKREEVALLVIPLSLSMLVATVSVVPQSLLTQRLRFASITQAQVVGSLVAAAAAVGAALSGAGYWSLALQPLVGGLVTGALMARAAAWAPQGWPEFSAVKAMLGFSGNLLGSHLVNWLGRSLPSLILGRQMSASQLAAYGLASGITGAVLTQISAVIVRVLFPTLSALKEEPERLHNAWSQACSGIAITAFPLLAVIIGTAPDFVWVVLGSQWHEAVEPLRWLTAAMALQAVFTTSSTVIMALGRTDWLLKLSVLTTVALGVALLIGVRFGLEGAAIAYALVSGASYLLSAALACKVSGYPLSRLLGSLAPWSLAALVGGLGAWWITSSIDWSPLPRLALSSLVGGAGYVVGLLLLAPRRTLSLVHGIWSRLRP